LKLTGHIRAKFHWEDDRIDASWVIPWFCQLTSENWTPGVWNSSSEGFD
jgi:hypothetical protein